MYIPASCLWLVHNGIITAPRSSLIASGISWAFIRCSAIRQVRILCRFSFSSTLFSIISQLAYCILCICAFFHTSLFIPTLSLHIFIFRSWGLKLNVYACISLVYIAIQSIHLSITLHMNKYPIIHSQFHELLILSSLQSTDSKYLAPLIRT